ncbi:MAG: acyl-CoA thioester hydrolase [Pseudonocardiales bacterium]|nr:acyl-CoA thioester hydrolase [Pseudonocardiales bacterium]MDT7576804.1 acyl-CoA thioester hydrolase [Pseudonocardiales bacterium]
MTSIRTRFPVAVERTARYSDLDPTRRLGRDALLRWFEDARVAVERDAFGADLTTREHWQVKRLLASVRVDVLAPLKVTGRPYEVALGVTRIGTSSFTYAYAVYDGDDCVATGSSTSVHVDENGSAPLPDAVRAELERLRVDAPEPAREATDPARLVRESYPFRVDMRTRFGDLDTNRHVNNVALAGWYLDALAELHLDVLGYPTGGPLDSLAPSSLRIDYLTEVLYPAINQLRVGVVEVSDTAVRYACGLFDGPRCIGLAEATGGLSPDEDPELGPRLAAFAFRG